MVEYMTTKEINEQKWRRMNLIRNKLKEKSMSFSEIEQLFSKTVSNVVRRRTVQNYLAELKALGLIIYDEQTKVYASAESKRVFQSRHDYDIALKHSRNLVFSTRDEIRLVQTDPFKALDLIAAKDTRDVDLDCFSQHLRSGYPEVHKLIEEYRKFAGEKGSKSSVVSNFAFVQEEADSDPKVKEERKRIKKIDDLKALLVGKIFSIINQVQNGIPLQGFCDFCPDREITIKDS